MRDYLKIAAAVVGSTLYFFTEHHWAFIALIFFFAWLIVDVARLLISESRQPRDAVELAEYRHVGGDRSRR